MVRNIASLASAALYLLLLHMILLGSSAPQLRTATIRLPDWPANTPPLRIALIADLHVAAPSDTPEHLQRIVDRINAAKPDLVLIAGDFISSNSLVTRSYPIEIAMAPLRSLRARMGIVAVLGNHDYPDAQALRATLEPWGIRLLDNEVDRRGPLTILGVGDLSTHHARLQRTVAAWRLAGGVPVMLTHNPLVTRRLPPDVHLALAGHTHCGQISFPLVGPLFYLDREPSLPGVCGLTFQGSRALVVSSGLGTSNLPLRLGVAPDTWMITISG
jgi:predicted MPP superfamily phosphohydrolase